MTRLIDRRGREKEVDTLYATLIHPDWGYEEDIEAAKVLTKDATYRIAVKEVGDWVTTYKLDGHGGTFNAIQFREL